MSDIIFLALGFYPYIDCEKILYNNKLLYLYRGQKNIYKKNSSYAHWSTIITYSTSFSWEEVYKKFKERKWKNDIIIEALAEVVHIKEGFAIDFIVSILIQCVEGYTRAWLTKNFYRNNDDASVSLYKCIKQAFNKNQYTKYLLNGEDANDFFLKSKNTRNQFAHMINKGKCFSGIYELLKVKEKYIILIRLLLLDYLNININKQKLFNYIDKINNEYCVKNI